jgi:orotate phosphoribosyltransferase-like protein
VIHKSKSLYDNGNGLTERKIGKELGFSRNTVSKFLLIPETEMARQLDDIVRAKKLATYRAYIIQLLQTYHGLSAVKVMRKLKAKVDSLAVSDRSVPLSLAHYRPSTVGGREKRPACHPGSDAQVLWL